MRRQRQQVSWVLGFLVPLSLGVGGSAIDVTPESRLWVSGTSSMRAFECRARVFDATVESALPEATVAVLSGEKGIGGVRVSVTTDSLECGNGTMNGHLRKALKAQEHAQVSFQLETYELARAVDSVQVTLNGSLTIGGTSKPVTITAAARAEGAGLRVAGAFDLKMTEFGLKPPTMMFGRMKVGDKVMVHFDFILAEPSH